MPELDQETVKRRCENMFNEHRRQRRRPTEDLWRTREPKEYIRVIDEWTLQRHTHNPESLANTGATQVEKSFPYSPANTEPDSHSYFESTTDPSSIGDLSDSETSLNKRKKKRKKASNSTGINDYLIKYYETLNQSMKMIESSALRIADAVENMVEILRATLTR